MTFRFRCIAILTITSVMGMAAVFGRQATIVPPAKTHDAATCPVFKGKLFELKYRDAGELVGILQALGSGHSGTAINGSRGSNILTVRDCPDNLVAIEEALKVLDTPKVANPVPATPDVELHLHVLIGSNTAAAGDTYPAELKDVLKQLQLTLTYKSYSLLTSVVQRAKLGQMGVQGSGSAVMGAPVFEKAMDAAYAFHIGGVTSESGGAANSSVLLSRFEFNIDSGPVRPDKTNFGHAGVETNVSIREGEKVVVGTASLQDKALVLVLTAKVLK